MPPEAHVMKLPDRVDPEQKARTDPYGRHGISMPVRLEPLAEQIEDERDGREGEDETDAVAHEGLEPFATTRITDIDSL